MNAKLHEDLVICDRWLVCGIKFILDNQWDFDSGRFDPTYFWAHEIGASKQSLKQLTAASSFDWGGTGIVQHVIRY